jgi:hypothetical protein
MTGKITQTQSVANEPKITTGACLQIITLSSIASHIHPASRAIGGNQATKKTLKEEALDG